jgi:hypothetical protein
MKRYLIAGALLAVAGSAMAGFNYGTYDVFVNTTGRAASGGISLSRRTPDSVQYISCATLKFSTGAETGNCSARDKNYTSGFCTTLDPQMLATIRSMGPSSYVLFQWDASGVCTLVESINSSWAI